MYIRSLLGTELLPLTGKLGHITAVTVYVLKNAVVLMKYRLERFKNLYYNY